MGFGDAFLEKARDGSEPGVPVMGVIYPKLQSNVGGCSTMGFLRSGASWLHSVSTLP